MGRNLPLGVTGSNKEFLHYLLTNQHARHFNSLLKFNLAYLQTFHLPYLSFSTRKRGGEAGLFPE